MNVKLKRTPGIYLVGFMGSGKSTIGRLLAHRLGWSFFDMDHEIEAAERSTVREIFETRGEPEFRRIEAAILDIPPAAFAGPCAIRGSVSRAAGSLPVRGYPHRDYRR